MSTSTIVRVTVDTPCTMTVTGVSEAQGQYGPQIRFDGKDGNGEVTVFEKMERVDEQLRRAGLDRESVIGKTVTIYKENATANGRTFPALRIRADGAQTPSTNGKTPQPTSIGPALPYERDERADVKAVADLTPIFGLYDRCLTYAIQCAKSAGITDQQAIVAMTATLFIQAKGAR